MFNARLDAAGVMPEMRLPTGHVPKELSRPDGGRISRNHFIAFADGVVRGGYCLTHHDFAFNGEIHSIAFLGLPLSEGIIDRSFAALGVQLLRHALTQQPFLYGLGMGGLDQPLPRILKTMGWALCLVPFYFKVIHPTRFLRSVTVLRATRFRRLLMDLASATGTGWFGIHAIQLLRTRRPSGQRTEWELVHGFGQWADTVWDKSKTHYAMVAVRDSETLQLLYPQPSKRFVCLKVSRQGLAVGWAVLLDTPMRNHKYFPNLRVGTVVDALASPEDAAAVVWAATQVLEARGVDLIVSNQSHQAWGRALRRAGYLSGPSNLAFTAAPQLAHRLRPFEVNQCRIHMNRGDGDGPIHL